MTKTEDEVRDNAKLILGFNVTEKGVKQGTGQITTFNQLGFKGVSDKPDGWYLPENKQDVAIILETKSEDEDLQKDKWVKELQKNISIVKKKYNKIIGILYNGKDIRIFKDNLELTNCSSVLQNKNYYINLFQNNAIDKQEIYRLTKNINDTLHVQFGIKNLYHRMIFTACALVAKRYDAQMIKGMDYNLLKFSILNTLSKSLEDAKNQNNKLELLIDQYSKIEMNYTANQDAIDNFICCVEKISKCVNSDYWNGEDVMGIFFNEFNRYKKKSENGQVFTPDHITSFIYRLIDVNSNDRVLDAACGSGAFLVKAMCNMIKEAGGIRTAKAEQIKTSQLFGIELDKEIFALACANMLIHKDGKTNLTQDDTRLDVAKQWISQKRITKVMMNPPFERKYGCLTIVKNVLDSVPSNTKCAFILPDKKLEKDMIDKKYGNKLLKEHRLETIVKLPENLFSQGITTSIFLFTSGVAQDGKNIIGYYVEDDGLETVKNQGRQDLHDRWHDIEDYWVRAIHDGVDDKYNTRQIIEPSKNLSYQMPEKEFSVSEDDFFKTMLDYEMYQQEIDVKSFSDELLKKILYGKKCQND